MSISTYRGKSRTGGTTSMFISRWDTTQAGSANDTIILPFVADGDYDFYVDWGDGTRDNITTYNQAEVTHQYSNTGIYEVRVYGGITGWFFDNAGDDDKITQISNWGPFAFSAQNNVFFGCSNLNITASDSDNLVIKNGLNAFRSCPKLIGGLANADTSTVTDMEGMFKDSTLFNDDVSSWNTSNVTDMYTIFQSCINFNQDLGSWDVSGVTRFGYMFYNATNFNNGGSSSISGWDTSSLVGSEALIFTFHGTDFNQDIGNWQLSGVTSLAYMLTNASNFNNGGSSSISGWDVSNVQDMRHIFENTSFNQPVGTWDVGSATNMENLFNNCSTFDQDVSNWNVSGVQNLQGVFRNCSAFTNGGSDGISGWDTSSATTLYTMFQSCTGFNQPIGAWDTSKVTTIGYTLYGCDSFDQDLSNWVVTGITEASTFMQTANGLSTTNYDLTLSGWAQQSGDLQSGVSIDFGNSQYSIATGEQYKAILSGAGWTIVDGGSV
jgi:surface protein